MEQLVAYLKSENTRYGYLIILDFGEIDAEDIKIYLRNVVKSLGREGFKIKIIDIDASKKLTASQL